jgi:truncated hemoglobin YjbI
MMAIQSTVKTSVAIPQIETALVDKIIDVCFDKMLDDYRVNRFFNNRPANEQTKPLKSLVKLLLSGARLSEQLDVLNEYLTAAFARSNAKPSLVTGNDFAFLLDVIGGQDIQTITPLCECHCFLLKLGPDDSHYDVLMEHLQSSLKELNVSHELSQQFLGFAESGREGCLGRLEKLA